MSETVVHVTTLEQWKSVLDVWFKQGYKWNHINDKCYMEHIFNHGAQYLILDNKYIRQSLNNFCERPFIEYSDFIAQQKEDKEVKTYYVLQETLNTIEDLKNKEFPLHGLLNDTGRALSYGLNDDEERALLRYLGGDETIELKVKEHLYRLWLIDSDGDKLFFWIDDGRPDWVGAEDEAFTAPLEEIKKWKTPAWEIEKAD